MTDTGTQTKARIYPAGKRGITASDGHTVYHTFNDGQYSAIGREPFSGIRALNDEVLKAGMTVRHASAENSLVLLLPVIGKIKFRLGEAEGRFLDPDTSQLIYVPKDATLEITNPYREQTINYVLVWFQTQPVSRYFDQFALFDLQKKHDSLVQIFTTTQSAGYIGKFSGRSDQTFALRESAKGVLVFVLEGAFEMEKRLLEPRDALALHHLSSIEFEALSNNAILLLIEV